MSDLGRQIKYGIGKGSDVAASAWFNQLSFDLNPKADTVNNSSAYGVLEKTNSVDVLRTWTEGSMEAKLTSDLAGYILLGAFGTVADADNADTNPVVKDHTFTINQSIAGQTFTFVRKDSITTKKFTFGRVGKWELNMALDDYIRYTADIMAKAGVTTTATPAYVAEPEFLPKYIGVKTASTVSGLSGATNLLAVESMTITMDPNLEADNEFGNVGPYSFTSRGFDLTFEMEARYNDTTFEDAYNAATPLALQISLVNTDVTIGAAAHPGLVFTAPKVTITDWSRSEDIDKPATQKLTGTIQYSLADAYALKAVLTNTTASY